MVSILNDIHETLIIKTLKINTFFFLLAFAGILILGIIYTNRVCGPLYRVKFILKSVAEGRIDTPMRFRQNVFQSEREV
jgi:hypothetical protein